jgi:hypothetical protein
LTGRADAHNALVDLDERFETRRAAARGPLAGWTLAIKANIEVEGLPAAAGTAALAGWVARADAPVVARLRAAGATVLGTANMHELAFGSTSAASAHGPVRNPRDPERAAGGSSGGSAAAVAGGHFRRQALGRVLVARAGQDDHAWSPVELMVRVEPLHPPARWLGAEGERAARVGELGDGEDRRHSLDGT